jgi:hypothetical protein
VATPVLAPNTITDNASRISQKLLPKLPSLLALGESGAVLIIRPLELDKNAAVIQIKPG